MVETSRDDIKYQVSSRTSNTKEMASKSQMFEEKLNNKVTVETIQIDFNGKCLIKCTAEGHEDTPLLYLPRQDKTRHACSKQGTLHYIYHFIRAYLQLVLSVDIGMIKNNGTGIQTVSKPTLSLTNYAKHQRVCII